MEGNFVAESSKIVAYMGPMMLLTEPVEASNHVLFGRAKQVELRVGEQILMKCLDG